MNNGSTINAVTPEFIQACSLNIDTLSDLGDGRMVINGFGELFSLSWDYVIVKVQVEGVRGYDKDQVALAMPDSTAFGSQVPVTLGTPTINQIINVVKRAK